MGDIVTAMVRHICTRWKCKVTDMVVDVLYNNHIMLTLSHTLSTMRATVSVLFAGI